MTTLERIRLEVREIGLVTLYFLAWFLFFLSLKKLILAEYDVKVSVIGTAVIGALIVAKVIVLLGKTSFGNFFAGGRPILHVLWRSLLYTAAVFVVTLAERLFDLYRETGGLPAAAEELWAGKDFDHFLAMNLTVMFSLVVYNVLSEIQPMMGEGGLRRFFFGRRSTPE